MDIAAPAEGALLTVQKTSQRFVVGGKTVQIEAYSINSSRYVPRVGDRSSRKNTAKLPEEHF